MNIGEKISPILVDIEDTLWEFESTIGAKPGFTPDGFRAATKIFMAALMDKAWELQASENITMEDRGRMVTALATDVRKVIKTYTDIDTHDMYK